MTNNPSAIDPRRPVKRRASYLTFPLATLCLASVPFTAARAGDGTWNTDGNANWNTSTTAPWKDGIVAEGADATAFFNTIDIAGDRTVTLTASRTIGNLYFGDVTAPTKNWILSSSGTGTKLMLDTTSGVPTIKVDNGTTTINATLDGNDGLIKDGTGTLILNKLATLTGTTTIKAGTLQIGNGSGSGGLSGNVDIYSGASLTFSRGDNTPGYNFGYMVSGAGSINKLNSSAVLTLSGNNTYSGGTTLTAGTLLVGSDTALGSGTVTIKQGTRLGSSDDTTKTLTNALDVSGIGNTQTVTFGALQGATSGLGDIIFSDSSSGAALGSGGTIIVNNSTTVTLNKRFNSGQITKAGTGTLVLAGDNTYTSATTISAGTLQIGNGGNTGTLGSGSVSNSGSLVFNRSNGYSVANAISGSGSVTQVGSGTTTLTGANNYAGGTTVSAGTLELSGSGTLGSGAVTVSGGTLNLGGKAITNSLGAVTGGTVTNGAITNNAGAFDVRNGSVSAILAGTNGLNKTTSGTVILSGANTYSGGTTIGAGTLALSDSGSLGTGAISVANGATLNLTGLGSGYTVASDTTLTNNGTVSGSLLVAGTLKGAGTFSGNTTITGIHSPGNSPDIQTFGDLTYSGGAATVSWELTQNAATQGTPAVFDQVIVLGDLSFAGLTTLNLIFNTSGSTVDWEDSFWGADQSWLLFDVAGSTNGFGNLTIAGTGLLDSSGDDFGTFLPGSSFSLSLNGNDVYLNYSAIPEPSTYAAIAGGLVLGAVVIRRCRRALAEAQA